jgi:hypothetical protein
MKNKKAIFFSNFFPILRDFDFIYFFKNTHTHIVGGLV